MWRIGMRFGAIARFLDRAACRSGGLGDVRAIYTFSASSYRFESLRQVLYIGEFYYLRDTTYRGKMLIVQISDLHVGSQFIEARFRQMAAEVNQMRPDVVIVTGDLTNEGILGEYEKCSKLLSTIRTKKMIAVSGNHDYRNTGYLLFRKYFPSSSINELDDGVVLATIGTARPDRNEGEVGYRQNLWLENSLKKYRSKIILVAMHHHLIDVPDTGSDHQTVRDAGDVLRTILDSEVRLVLCGHNHRPWMWDFGKLKVVNAGTATSERPRGLFANSYNIITIRDGRVDVDLKIVGGERAPLSDVVRKYSRFDSRQQT